MKLSEEKLSSEIEWTPKNILMLSLAILFIIGIIIYSISTANSDIVKKRQKLEAMSLSEVGEYILNKNQGTVTIDHITKVRNMHLSGNTLEVPYYVSEGFLHKLSSSIESQKNIKKSIQKDTLNENCSKTAFSVFLEKGGTLHYIYRLEKGHNTSYMFDFNNTWEMCLHPKNL